MLKINPVRKTLLFFPVALLLGIIMFYGGGIFLYKIQLTATPAPGGFVNPKFDLIQVTEPAVDSKISSPVKVSGQARGYWFFEASFPVKIVDAKGVVLGQGVAQAKTDWMTQEFVAFDALVEFSQSDDSNGFIILEKDNPSGLPENANELRWPVEFSP